MKPSRVHHVRRWRRRRDRPGIESPGGIIFFRGWTWLNRRRTGRRPFKRANRRRGGVRRDARQLRGKCNFMPRFPSFSSSPAGQGKKSSRLHAWLARRRCDSSFDRRRRVKKNREERRCLFDYREERERKRERSLRLMFARWMERWRLKGGEDLGRNDEFFLEGRNYFVILDNIVGNIPCECFF